MLLNYLKITWRNLKQNKSYTLINLLGLTVGMCCCILIALYIKSELSYDSFNAKADRIVAVSSYTKGFGQMITTPFPLAHALKNEVPEVDDAVITRSSYGGMTVGTDKQHFSQLSTAQYTQPSFFNIFSFHLLQGAPHQALAQPNSIVLTQKSAKQLFGKKQAMGQTLFWQLSDTVRTLKVTGIAAAPPKNSSIQFNALLSMKTWNVINPGRDFANEWHSYSYITFALLNEHATTKQLDNSLQTIVKNHFKKDFKSGFASIPLSSYHLSQYTSRRKKGFTGKRLYVFLFGSIALFVLLIACINYVNLATARATMRAKEVGVRKTLGAQRFQVMVQFWGESILLCFGSFLIALYLAALILPLFNHLFGTTLAIWTHIYFLGWLALASIIVGILAGSYPALYMSGFAPISVIRNRLHEGHSKGGMRKALVVMQFTLASVFIIGSVAVYKQLKYTQNKDLGFNGTQVALFNMPTGQMWQNRANVRRSIAALPGVRQVSAATGAPGAFYLRLGLLAKKYSPDIKTDPKKQITFEPALVDYNYLPTLHIKLLAGRNFSQKYPSDRESAFIVNKTAVEALGWKPKEAVGKPFTFKDVSGKIIGVTQNFNTASLHQPITPVILQLKKSKTWSGPGMILAKLGPNHISKTVEAIKNVMKKSAPHHTITYQFLDQMFDAMYRSDRRLGKVFGVFTFIAVIVACLGLFGLSTFSANRRTKEIGVRKVMGATVRNIVRLLSYDFLKLVALGFVIAVPLGWGLMHYYLQSFAYKVSVGPSIFLLAGGLALVIALATVSWQSIKAALANPVDSLRSE